MTSDQRSFLSKAGAPILLYTTGLAGVCALSAIWGMTDHAFAIDLVAVGFVYLLALSVFLGAVRVARDADDAAPAAAATHEPPHDLRQAA